MLCFLSNAVLAEKFVHVHFLYGSKPARGYKHIEDKWFGGLHGGHVSIQLDSTITGFEPRGGCHIFSQKKRKHCKYLLESHDDWIEDTAGLKYLSISIPVRDSQYDSLKAIQKKYVKETPFDYAFLGMRCASSTYEILSLIGIFPEKSRFMNCLSHFYPKPFRKKMKRIASERGWVSSFHEGRKSRQWEKDYFFKK